MSERAKISDATMILLGMGQLGALFFWSFHGASMQAGGKLIEIIGFRLVFASGGIFIAIGFIIFQFIRTPKNDIIGNNPVM
jgi:hypothetical protein